VRSVTYICDDAIKSVSVKIAPAHFNDRTETAIKCAAARGLYHICLPAKHRIAFQHSRIAIWRAYLAAVESAHGPVSVVIETVAPSVRKSRYMVVTALVFNSA